MPAMPWRFAEACSACGGSFGAARWIGSNCDNDPNGYDAGFGLWRKKWWACEHRDVANMANAIGQNADRLFCFLDREGVEPTNNVAERALRTAVQWRKTSFGNRSEAGALATARLLTVAQTCAQQKRDTLAYLTDAVSSHRSRKPAPSLLQ